MCGHFPSMSQKHTWLGHSSLENIHNEFLQWIDQRPPCKNSGCNIRLTAGRGEIQWVEDQTAQWRNTPVLKTLLWSGSVGHNKKCTKFHHSPDPLSLHSCNLARHNPNTSKYKAKEKMSDTKKLCCLFELFKGRCL